MAHEAGHFFAAKLCGVKVKEFSIGFPPRVLSFKRKETQYTIGLIPLGGYVSMLGENDTSKDPRAFNNQPPGKRAIIAVAGVVMNVILAWIILTIGFSVGMSPLVTEPGKIPGEIISSKLIVAGAVAGTPAASIGLLKNDVIISATSGDEKIKFSGNVSLSDFTSSHKSKQIDLLYERNGQKIQTSVVVSSDGILGIEYVDQTIVRVPWHKAPYVALRETYAVVATTFKLIGQFFATLFSTGKISNDVGGPVAIYVYTGLAVQAGVVVLLQFIALLSVSLALFNILPFPALDGSRLLFIILEKIARRRVVKEEIEAIIHTVGFFLLILLVLAIAYKDVVRFFYK